MRSFCQDGDLQEVLGRSRAMTDERFGRRVELFFTFFQTKMLPVLPMVDPENYGFVQGLADELGPVSPVVDLSRGSCELNCEHCDRQYLKAMEPMLSVDDLVADALRRAESGSRGMLLSAGSCRDGSTMIDASYYDGFRKIKEQTDLYLGVHSGYATPEQVRAYRDAGVDAVLVDVIGDQETLSEVYHINRPHGIVRETIDSCFDAGIDVIPHICAGLRFGEISGEYAAIELLAEYPIKYLTVIILIPTPGTGMEGIDPPSTEEVSRLIAYGRMRLPETIISLGCMRPLGEYSVQMEQRALELGCNRIANVSAQSTIQRCITDGIEYSLGASCCMVGNGMFDMERSLGSAASRDDG